ncbi:MAG TPA: hypothetical protein VF516_31635 [Kofleriaceae bacterium]
MLDAAVVALAAAISKQLGTGVLPRGGGAVDHEERALVAARVLGGLAGDVAQELPRVGGGGGGVTVPARRSRWRYHQVPGAPATGCARLVDMLDLVGGLSFPGNPVASLASCTARAGEERAQRKIGRAIARDRRTLVSEPSSSKSLRRERCRLR